MSGGFDFLRAARGEPRDDPAHRPDARVAGDSPSLQATASSIRLGWRRTVRRIGRIGLAAAVLVPLAVVLHAATGRLMEEASELEQAAAQRAEQLRVSGSGPARPTVSAGERLARFTSTFPAATESSADLDLVFRRAAARGLVLDKGEYQMRTDADASLQIYTATFPAHATYGAIRDFSADVLRALPNASLEELRIARDSTESTALDAVIRLSFIYRSSSR